MADDARSRALALADQWERYSDAMRAQSVADGLHPALASAHREANLIRMLAADLRAALDAEVPGA